MTERHHRPDHRVDRLGELVRGVARRRSEGRQRRPERSARDLSGRLEDLEQDVREVRTRINALFFAVLTAALGDLAGRVVLG